MSSVILIACGLAGSIIVVCAVLQAPDGWEDREGFHLGEPDNSTKPANVDLRRSA